MNNTHAKDLTLLEKAVLSHLYLHNIKDWTPYYLALNPQTTATGQSLTKAVSLFRRSARVQQYLRVLEQLQPVQFARVQQTRDRETDEKINGNGMFADGLKDFTDITAFLEYCNERANSATNERDRQQYLKFISDLLSFKNSGNDQKTDIQRFYSPLQCSACPLYQKESEK